MHAWLLIVGMNPSPKLFWYTCAWGAVSWPHHNGYGICPRCLFGRDKPLALQLVR